MKKALESKEVDKEMVFLISIMPVIDEKKGKALKEINVEDVNLQVNSDWFKAMQG